MKPSEALAAHRTELLQIVSRYGLARPRVFGSVVDGTDTNGSDLDLLVEPGRSTSLLTLAGLKKRRGRIVGGAGIRSDSGWIAAKVSQRGAAASAAPMKHLERVENYLEHIAEANDRPTSYLQPVQDLEAFQEKRQVQDAVVATSRSLAKP